MRGARISGKPALCPISSSWIHLKFFAAAGIVLFLLLSLAICPLWSFHHRSEILSSRTSSWTSSSSPPPSRSLPSSPSSSSRIDLLHYTALDNSDGEEKEKIRMFLDERSSSRVWRSSGNGMEAYERRRPTIRRLRDRRWAPDLSNPRYAPYTGDFRAMLQGWAAKKRFDPGVMRRLLPEIKEVVDRHFRNSSTPSSPDDRDEEAVIKGVGTGRRSSLSSLKLLGQGQDARRRSHRNEEIEEQDGTENDAAAAAGDGRTRRGRSMLSSYKTCAVVGNGGFLLNRTYGTLIDSHDMVMRLNNAKVVGFQHQVGSKTTISFVNSNIVHSCSRRLRCSCSSSYADDVPVVSYICQVAHFLDVAYCRAFRRAPLLVTDPRFDSLSTRIVRYYSLRRFFHSTGRSYDEWNKLHDGTLFHYSSGMQAVMLALGICEEVSLFGFGKLSNSTHHYHTNQKTELALHDYEAEYTLYDDLVHRPGLVPFLNESGLSIPPVKIFL